MAETRFKPGKTYYLRYKNYHTDPRPFLWILWSDKKYTIGYNIHYLPYIRFKVPIDRYKSQSEARFQNYYNDLLAAGYFRPFVKFLEKVSEAKITKARATTIGSYLTKRWPWSQRAFRKYHTPLLVLRNPKLDPT